MIVINIDKAKIIGHEMRRSARALEFAPLDEIIAKQIPNSGITDADRQLIRDKYAAIQVKIDSATTPDEIKEALKGATQ